MASIIEPKYDNEQVTYGFLKKVLSKNLEETSKEQKQYSKSFNSPPDPPYYIGWTYTQNNKIYRCIKDRLLGSFSIEDWVVLYDEKQSNLIAENFLFLSEIELLDQSDGKIETFYQDEDPAIEWNTSVLKSNHENDYWRTKVDGVYHSYIYTKMATNPVTWDWIEINVPICIFDTINTHKNIYTTIPDEYIKNDFLKIMNEEMLKHFSAFEYQIGDYLYAKDSNNTFNASDWIKKEDELSLKSLQSYYYTTDEINKIIEIVNAGIETDIKKSEDSITAYVKESYTKKTTTEEIKKKVDANGKTIEEIKGTNTTEIPTLNLSQLSIALDQISEEVQKTINLTNIVSSENKLVLSNAVEGEIVSLKISGKMSFLFPSKKLLPSKTLFGKTSYLIIEYEDGTSYKTKLPIKRMRVFNDVRDEFIIDSDGTRLIKRIGVTEDNQEYILSTEKVINYDNITIPLKKGTNTIYLSSFKNDSLSFSGEYAIQNEFTNTFATKLEMASKILASANGILLETKRQIDQATDINTLVSRINMSPEEIKLLAKKIVFEGLVTANKKFKILDDGSMEAVDGKFKGNVYLENGNKVIGGAGITTNLYFSSSGLYHNYDWVGFKELSAENITYSYADLELDVNIPDNFTIISAYVTMFHTPAYWNYYSQGSDVSGNVWGYPRNLKLYKVNSEENYNFYMTYGGEYELTSGTMSLLEITNAFGASSYTPNNTSGNSIESKQSINIKDYLNVGHNKLIIRSADSIPTNDEATCCAKTGMGRAIVNIIGYLSF